MPLDALRTKVQYFSPAYCAHAVNTATEKQTFVQLRLL